MKTDIELEALLRETFAGRAQSVHDAARWVAPARAPRRLRRWVPALAAAVTVALVAAGVVIAGQLTHSDHKVIKPAPVVPTVCRTALPSAWLAALPAAVLDAGAWSAGAIALAPDGSVIALRDYGVHPGDAREIVQLRPGSAPRVLYSSPDPDTFGVRSAGLIDHWLIVGVHHDARPPKHTIPGSSPIGLASVLLVDTRTGEARTLAEQRDTGRSINMVVTFDGKAYWDERASFPARNGVVKSFDPRTGKTRTVYHGRIGWLEVSAAGVGFQGERALLVPARLPDQVERAMTPFSRYHLVTDGTAYAWLVSQRVLGWWAPGQAAPVYRKVRYGMDPQLGPDALKVAGRFVLTERGELVDPVHGGSAVLPTARFTGIAGASLDLGSNGVLAGSAPTERNGHWIDGYWSDGTATVVRLDTRGLPPLRC